MNKTNPLRRTQLWTLSALAIAVANTFTPCSAQADQDQDDTTQAASASKTDDQNIETIVVTGSRIKQIDLAGPSPVTVISKEEIEQSGKLTVSDYLHDMNYNSFGSFVPASGYGGGAAGGADISLRGLGSERTLVLIDGRRMPLDPGFSATAANLNIIPFAIVDRIEVLRDGASAIYGSDAIGGVINVITKKDFNGLEFTGQLDRPTGSGGDGANATLTGGLSNDKGNIYFSLDHAQKDAISYKDRSWAKGAYSAYGNPGTVAYAVNPTTGDEDTSVEGVSGGAIACPSSFDSDSTYKDSATVGDICRYRFGSVAWITAATARDTLSVGGNYNFNPGITGFTRMSLTRGESKSVYAPAPASSGFDNDVGLPMMSADNVNNTTGDDLYFYLRPTENGARVDTITDTIVDLVGGVRGSFDLWRPTDWEVALTHSRYAQTDIGTGYGLASALQAAIDDGTYNPLDPSSNTASAADAFNYTISNNNLYVNQGIDGHLSIDNLLSGSFRVPLVIGGEYRDEAFRQLSDAQSDTSFVLDDTGTITDYHLSNVYGSSGGSSQGGRSEYAMYLESELGFLDNRLTVDGALRYDHYNSGAARTSPKIAVAVRPADSLLLRASYSEGFRAPTLYDLYAAPSQSFEAAEDTWLCDSSGDSDACDQSVQRQSFFVGSAALKPETSKNISAGVVFNPIDKLSLEIDYYDIKLKNGIESLTAQQVLDNDNDCRNDGESDGCTDSATKGHVYRNTDDTVNFLYIPKINASNIDTDGFDFSGKYQVGMGRAGRLGLTLDVSYVLSYKVQDGAGEQTYDYIGSILYPSTKGKFGVNWDYRRFTTSVITNYTSKTRDCDYTGGCGLGDVPSFTTYDAQLSWIAPWNSTFTVGVRNLTDKDPPASDYYAGSSDPQGRVSMLGVYSFEGRVPYLSYKQDF
ncbi:TonB-dependent receptor plug domain-containing protein [Solimonas marina]|uniref:TonB-dependent receptor n=1 Tax=Solimonas marina TaxID=2714601 RepID=A0A969WES1_9GAMM|nr:TonB-dependent receptor [Solimonas marina]NKF24001.1 TonB-dependent receptor [Solimonas marina]